MRRSSTSVGFSVSAVENCRRLEIVTLRARRRQQGRQHHPRVGARAGQSGAGIQGGEADSCSARRATLNRCAWLFRRHRRSRCQRTHQRSTGSASTKTAVRPTWLLHRRLPPPSPSRRSLRGLDWFIFSRRRADRLRSLRRGLSHDTEMDAGRNWPHPFGERSRCVGGADARWRTGRCGTVGAACRRSRRGGIGVSAVAYAAWPIFPVVLAAAILPCRCELRAGSGHCRDQSRTCRPSCGRRALRP